MARLAATAVLLLSLLALANCRALEAEPEAVSAISDEQQGQANPTVPQETDAAEAISGLPTVTVAEAILQLPSQRRPCRHGFLHRHLRWARHHGLSHRPGAFAGPGEARVFPAVLPEEPKGVEVELEAVAEPDPDTRPDTDGEQKPIHGEEEVEGEENESVKAWKGKMLRRFRGHGLRFHHRHHHEKDMAVEKEDGDHQEQEDKADSIAGMHAKMFSRHFQHHHHGDHQEQEDKEEGAGDMQLQHVKMFSRHFHHPRGVEEHEQQNKEEGVERVPVELVGRHFHHHHGDEEQNETARKPFFHHHHHHDSDNEVDEVEELARRLSKAIMRRRFSRGGIRHQLHHHAEEGGVRKWFKGLLNMNRF